MDITEPLVPMVGHVKVPQAKPPANQSGDAGPAPTCPTYAGAFKCIGASCEDDCCHTWTIPLDKNTYRLYQNFPVEKLGSVVAEYVSVKTAETHDNLFAQITRNDSGACPFYTSGRLCGIQEEYGPQLLSATCSIYPRVLNLVDSRLEGSLSLSCPQAARDVLLVPHSTQVVSDLLSGAFRTDNYFTLTSNEASYGHKPYSAFHDVRRCMIALVTDRSRPVWERLLLIGSLCKQLDEIPTDGALSKVFAILVDYHRVVGTERGCSETENLPTDLALKLRVLFKFVSERAQDKTCGTRFLDTYWDFVEGIGSSEGAKPGEDVERMRHAEEFYHRPFFEARPYIFENYLLNHMFKTLFPFGRARSADFVARSIFDEYILMATQFAIINGLLIGIAGHFKEGFSEEHVVKTIQSFARELDHDPTALDSMIEFMQKTNLGNLVGISILLKN
ncbi:flagellin lysine-N-methylase [Granulicella aggregans]|nr:flagellin lysine-N-methylase [Granulicella aggregans]